MKSTLKSDILIIIALVGLLVGSVYTGYWFLHKKAPSLVVSTIPIEVDHRLGKFIAQSMKNKVIENKEVNNDLQSLAAPLTELAQQRLPFDLELAVVQSQQVNAFALPGGFIFFNSGLILKAESADQVLGVLAHEIAHVIERHSMKRLVSSVGLRLAVSTGVSAVFGNTSRVIESLAHLGPMLIEQKFSRDQERQADKLGTVLLVEANINPEGLVQFFEILQKESQHQDSNQITGFFATHPRPAERMKSLKQRVEKMDHQRFSTVSFDFKAFQERLRRL